MALVIIPLASLTACSEPPESISLIAPYITMATVTTTASVVMMFTTLIATFRPSQSEQPDAATLHVFPASDPVVGPVPAQMLIDAAEAMLARNK